MLQDNGNSLGKTEKTERKEHHQHSDVGARCHTRDVRVCKKVFYREMRRKAPEQAQIFGYGVLERSSTKARATMFQCVENVEGRTSRQM